MCHNIRIIQWKMICFFFDNETNNYDSYVVDESVQCQHLLFFKWAPAVGFGETGFTVQL